MRGSEEGEKSLRKAVEAGVTRLAWWEARQARLWVSVGAAKRWQFVMMEGEVVSVMLEYMKEVARWLPKARIYVMRSCGAVERVKLDRVEKVDVGALRCLLYRGRGKVGGDVVVTRATVGNLLECRRSVQRFCGCLQEKWAAED